MGFLNERLIFVKYYKMQNKKKYRKPKIACGKLLMHMISFNCFPEGCVIINCVIASFCNEVKSKRCTTKISSPHREKSKYKEVKRLIQAYQ